MFTTEEKIEGEGMDAAEGGKGDGDGAGGGKVEGGLFTVLEGAWLPFS